MTQRQRTTLDELREHVELADHNELASATEIDERLDCALDCATQLLTERLDSDGWGKELRGDLENVAGVPYIYAEIRGAWYMIPPLFAEIEGSPIGYALSPLLPSSSLILRQLAQIVPRRELINLAHDEGAIALLIVHAYAPPVAMEATRATLIDALITLARAPADVNAETLGAWGHSITGVSLLTGDGMIYTSRGGDTEH